MIACCDSQVGTVLNQRDGKLKSEILKVCRKKTHISPDFVSNLVADQVGLEIHNKVNELNLIMANHISDRVIDEVTFVLNFVVALLKSSRAHLNDR